jgi:hypothetical protein
MDRLVVDVQLVVPEFDLALVLAKDRIILEYIALEEGMRMRWGEKGKGT